MGKYLSFYQDLKDIIKYLRYFAFTLIVCLGFITLLASGGGDDGDDDDNNGGSTSIQGFIQKGPFIQGSEVSIQVHGAGLTPTGDIFFTETVNDMGSFYVDADIDGAYLDIKTTGFYFNEITGELSDKSIILNAIVDAEESDSVNVNVLTSLSYERIKYLIKNNGVSFQDAQEQAEDEVLKIFNIDKDLLATQVSEFYEMDISKEGISNAILIAVCSVLQWGNTEAELAQLIADISSDLKTDGTLDNVTTIDEIRNNSKNLQPSVVRTNMIARYGSLGITTSVAIFEDFLDPDWDGTINLYENQTSDPSFGILNRGWNMLLPPEETYENNIYIFLSSATYGATIYFTTDGSEPTRSSNVFHEYSEYAPFTVIDPDDITCIPVIGDGTEITIKAIAVKEGLEDSNVVTATFTIHCPNAYSPIFGLTAGTYNEDISLSLISESKTALIYYTTDGSEPTHSSSIYSNPIQISVDGTAVTIKAIADTSWGEDSYVVTSYFKIDYEYDPAQYMTSLLIGDYQSKIVGTWIGQVETLWSYPYNVEITFYDTGNYSARSISQSYNYYGMYNEYTEWWGSALYYGTDDDNELKTYDIYDINGNGKAEADIVVWFGDGSGSTNYSKLKNITFYNNFKNMSFEYWHRNIYGPVTFTLTRKE